MNSANFVGLKIDQYLIEAHIARGGMADVYLARDVQLDRHVAFKVLLSALAQDPQFVKRFQREAQAVARLDHPNIVQVYSTGLMPGGQPYIAMQYVKGPSLREQLRRWEQQGKVAPAPQALAVVRHLASALDTAHKAGIVHRDLKPSNVLIRPDDGMPVLVDLGIATIQGSEKLTQTGSLIGTPHYMSPEQVRGEEVDGRSDIYSLGVILYELLAGVRPFEADESIAILHKHVYEAPLPIDQLRPGLSGPTLHLVDSCLQKEPARRFQTAAGLVAAIDRALQIEGQQGYILKTTVLLPEGEEELISRSRVVQPPAPVKKESSKKRFLAIGGVLVLVVIAGIVGVFALGIFDSGNPPTPAIAPSRILETDATENVIVVIEATFTPAAKEDAVTPEPRITEESVVPTIPPPTETVIPSITPMPPTLTLDLGPEQITIGRSVDNVPIEAVRFGNGQTSILFVGGIHAGYAPSSVTLAQRAINYFEEATNEIPKNVTLYIVKSLNPDSPIDPNRLGGRLNANGVDLNRNFNCNWAPDTKIFGKVVPGSGGTSPLSEPESQSLADFISEIEPVAVVFWGASGRVSVPGSCGKNSRVSDELAAIYGNAANYRVLDIEGNEELNGDVSNWLDQQDIPTIFALLEDEIALDWDDNLAAMWAVLRKYGS